MQCPDCKRLRHNGPCEPVYDEPDELELLAIDAAQAQERYERAARDARLKEEQHGRT